MPLSAAFERAMTMLRKAFDKAVTAFSKGQIDRPQLETVASILNRGAARFIPIIWNDVTTDGLVVLVGGRFSDGIVERAVDFLTGLVDDLVEPIPRRLLRRIDEIDRGALDSIIDVNDKSALMYRLAHQVVKLDPELAARAGVAFEGTKLVIDGELWTAGAFDAAPRAAA